MGNQCSSTTFNHQFQTIKQFEHSSLGPIKLIRSIKTYNNNNNNNNHNHNRSESQLSMMVSGQGGNSYGYGYEIRDGEVIGVREFGFRNLGERDQYVKVVKEANSYIKIPTLLRLLSYEVGKNNTSQGHLRALNNYRCGPAYTVSIYFPYYPSTLAQILAEKRQSLQSLHPKKKPPSSSSSSPLQPLLPLLPKSLKLNNYQSIDKLPHNERKIVNLFYQQVQILRFLDYVIGALYFLNHLEHRHQAVCPENVVIDQEGKFALVDAVVFRLGTNYDVGILETYNRSVVYGDDDIRNNLPNNRSGLKYLSPELLMNIKNKNSKHHENSQKAQIFSVGLIALDMCLLDYNILQGSGKQQQQQQQQMQYCPIPTPLLDRANLKINKTFLNKALIQAQARYSLELVDLLTLMLEYDPVKRINFSVLIDMLSPLLIQNLTKIQKLHNPTPTQIPTQPILNPNPISQTSRQPAQTSLMNKLSQLETNYQKIINKTIIFENSLVSDGNNQTHGGSGVGGVGVGGNGLDQKKIIEDQKRILRELRKINGNFGRKGLGVGGNQGRDNREVKGSDLYDIYLNEYETIKKNRFR